MRRNSGRKTRGEVVVHRCKDGTYTLRIRFQRHGRRQYERLFTEDRITAANLDEYQLRAEQELVARRWKWRHQERVSARGDLTIEQAVQQYLSWVAEHREPNTLKRYRWILNRFRAFAPTKLSGVTLDVLETYQRKIGPGREAAANNELAVIRGWWNWLLKRRVTNADPWGSYHPLRALGDRETTPRRLSDREIEALRTTAPPYVVDVFNFALWTGLRVGELIWLDPEDVHLVPPYVEVISKPRHRVKGQMRRVVELNAQAVELIERVGDRRPVFPSPKNGGRWRAMSKVVIEWMGKAGIENPKLHHCRSTFATRALEAGVSLRLVQRWMGHSSIRTTERYLGVPEGAERLDAARRLRF